MLGDMVLLAVEMLASLWGALLILGLLALFAGIYWATSPGAVFQLMVFASLGVFLLGTAGAGQFAWAASHMVFVPSIALAILLAAAATLALGAIGLIRRRG